MTTLHDEVISVLDSYPEDQGVIVVSADCELLAHREGMPGAACTLVAIGVEPFGLPDPEPKGARVGAWHVIEGGPAHRAATKGEQ